MDQSGNRVLNVGETARMLGRSTEQVRRYLREGVLPGKRIGGQWFVALADVETMLRRRTETASPAARRSVNRDPLGATIALGGTGGGNIAAGPIRYLRALRIEDRGA